MNQGRNRFSFIATIKWRAFGCVLIAFSPAILLLILIGQNAVNIPVWDGWERAALFEKFDAGTLTFGDLYAPHIDHRMVFPRLLMLILAYASDGDLRFDVVMTFVVGLLAGIGFWKLAKVTIGSSGWTMGLSFLCNLWIFSPMQYDNWLWPIQTSFMIPMTCLIWAVWATNQPWSWWKRLLVAGILAIVGTHSFSHGLFIWPTVLLLAALGAKQTNGKWMFVGVWLILAVIIIGCYFGIDYKTGTEYGYGRGIGSKPPLAESWSENLKTNGEKVTTFFLTMLGTPLVRQFAIDPFPPGRMAGILVLLMYGGFSAKALLSLRKKTGDERSEIWSRMLPWLAIGGAVIAISLGVATGRASVLAVARSTVPRLMSVALYLPLSLLVMSVILGGRARGKWFVTSKPVVIAFLIALQIQPWIYGHRLMELWRASRVQAQANVMFIEHFDPVPSRILAYLPPAVKRYAPVLNEKGWLDPPLVKTLDLDQFSISEKPLPPSKGLFAETTVLENGNLELRGTTCEQLPIRRPADAVLITMKTEAMNTPKIIGLADIAGTQQPTRYRIDLQFTALWELSVNAPGTWMEWREEIDISQFPKGEPITIQAWSFNLEKNKVYRLRNELILNADGTPNLIEEK